MDTSVDDPFGFGAHHQRQRRRRKLPSTLEGYLSTSNAANGDDHQNNANDKERNGPPVSSSLGISSTTGVSLASMSTPLSLPPPPSPPSPSRVDRVRNRRKVALVVDNNNTDDCNNKNNDDNNNDDDDDDDDHDDHDDDDDGTDTDRGQDDAYTITSTTHSAGIVKPFLKDRDSRLTLGTIDSSSGGSVLTTPQSNRETPRGFSRTDPRDGNDAEDVLLNGGSGSIDGNNAAFLGAMTGSRGNTTKTGTAATAVAASSATTPVPSSPWNVSRISPQETVSVLTADDALLRAGPAVIQRDSIVSMDSTQNQMRQQLLQLVASLQANLEESRNAREEQTTKIAEQDRRLQQARHTVQTMERRQKHREEELEQQVKNEQDMRRQPMHRNASKKPKRNDDRQHRR